MCPSRLCVATLYLSLTGVPRLVYSEAVLAWAESVHGPLYNTARHQLGQSDDSLGARGEVVTAHTQHGHTRPQYTSCTSCPHQHRHLPALLYRLLHLVRVPVSEHHHPLLGHVYGVVSEASGLQSSGHCLQYSSHSHSVHSTHYIGDD